MNDPTFVVEIALELTEGELAALLAWLGGGNEGDAPIPYYVEPPRNPPYRTLEEVEADCEGK